MQLIAVEGVERAGFLALLRSVTAVVVTRGSKPQQRLERDRFFQRAALDAKAAVYVRVPSNE